MALSHAQAVGFNDDVRKLFVEVKAVMIAANLGADKMIAHLADLQDRVGKANARQEDLKRQLKEATEEYTALKREMYSTASGYLDMAIAAVDKRSDAARNFRRLRSRITRPDLVARETVKPVPESAK